MKLAVRPLAAAALLAGLAASTHSQPAASLHAGNSMPSIKKVSFRPFPSCPPDDPDACGVGGGK